MLKEKSKSKKYNIKLCAEREVECEMRSGNRSINIRKNKSTIVKNLREKLSEKKRKEKQSQVEEKLIKVKW